MATITATPLPALGIVKVLIDWTPSQLGDLAHVYRVTPDTAQFEIIGSPVALSGGRAILYDTTAPFDTPLSYLAMIDNPIISKDAFSRIVSSSWGDDDISSTYTLTGGLSSEFSVTGSQGRIAIPSSGNGSSRQAYLPQTLTDMRVEATVSPGAVAVGSSIQAGISARYTSGDSLYLFAVQFQADGTTRAVIQRRITSPTGTVELAGMDLPFGYGANTKVRIVGEVVGTNLRMSAWGDTSAPDEWMLSTSDDNLASGKVGYRALLFNSNTNTSPTSLFFDNTLVTSLTPISVASAGTVSLDADPHGWIRDPQLPARSVRLDNCATHTFACLNADRFVFFQGLEEETYDSATGVFGVLNAENPLTVAQVRKGATVDMRVVSTTLADIPALRRLFSSGRDLVVSLPTRYGWGIESYGSESVTVGEVTVSRLNRREMAKPQRLWSLPLAITDDDDTYPTGAPGSNNIPVPGATYADMKATGLTYLQLSQASTLYPMVSDTFVRVPTLVPNGWETSTSGDLWRVQSGTVADYSVTSSKGRVAVSQRGVNRRIVVDNLEADSFGQVDITVPVVPTGGNIAIFVATRLLDSANYVLLGAFVEPTGVVNSAILTRYLNVISSIGTQVNTGITHTANTTYTIKYQMDGQTVRSKVWRPGVDSEPGWLNTGTVSNPPVVSSTGVHINLDPANTNTLPVTFLVDNVSINHEARTYQDWAQGVYA